MLRTKEAFTAAGLFLKQFIFCNGFGSAL